MNCERNSDMWLEFDTDTNTVCYIEITTGRRGTPSVHPMAFWLEIFELYKLPCPIDMDYHVDKGL